MDPTRLKSPINRPTKIMRELYKHSGHELTKWRDIFEPNEKLFKGKSTLNLIKVSLHGVFL